MCWEGPEHTLFSAAYSNVIFANKTFKIKSEEMICISQLIQSCFFHLRNVQNYMCGVFLGSQNRLHMFSFHFALHNVFCIQIPKRPSVLNETI